MAGPRVRPAPWAPPLDTLPRPSESPAASRVILCLPHVSSVETESGTACGELDPLCLTPTTTIAHLTPIIAHSSWGNVNYRGETGCGKRHKSF